MCRLEQIVFVFSGIVFASPSEWASFALKPFMNFCVIFLFTTRWKLLSVLISVCLVLSGGVKPDRLPKMMMTMKSRSLMANNISTD